MEENERYKEGNNGSPGGTKTTADGSLGIHQSKYGNEY